MRTGLGKVCLYTTAKCRSMTTKSEFVEMWNNVEDNVKYVSFDFGWIKATNYRIISGFVELEEGGIEVGYIDLEEILEVN